MTHVSETSLGDATRDALHGAFGVDGIESQVYLDASGRYADFVARRGDVVYTVEVENGWESVTDAVGQACLYAGHYDDAVPVVAFPEGHADQPEFDLLRQQVPQVRFLEVQHD